MSDWDNFWNSVGNAVEDAAEAVGNVVEDAVNEVVDFVEDVVDTVEDVVQDVGEVLEDVAEDVGQVVEDVVDWTLTVADTVIFDPVDFITGGAVDVDYENGQFTGELDLGFGSAGISMGQQGFDAHAGFDIGIASGNMSYDDGTGFAMGGSVGFDGGPLPYAEGHLDIGHDGTISIGGEVQATLPLPFGTSIGGDMSGEMHRNADGTYGASSLVDVFVDGPGDTGASFHNDSSVQLGRDGFDAATNTDILINGPRGTDVEVQTGASAHLGRDGIQLGTDFDADANLPGGREFDADGGGNPISATDADNDTMASLNKAAQANNDMQRAVSSMSALAGSGDLSDALSSGAADADEVADLVDSDAFDDFTTDIVSSEVMESAAEGVWDDVGP